MSISHIKDVLNDPLIIYVPVFLKALGNHVL